MCTQVYNTLSSIFRMLTIFFVEKKSYGFSLGKFLIPFSFFQSKIDKHRFHGSHSKFMVTDQAGYIGTSNWAEDYFTDTAGTCITFQPEPILNPLVESAKEKLNLVQQMEKIFQRDWGSSLSKHI